MAELPGFAALLATIARLRAPDGCPWDKKQTTESMAPHLVEEAFEAADALRRSDDDESQKELGDVLVNVAMISQIASESGRFAADDVAQAASDKLIRRHPHVFGDQQAESAEIAFQTWEAQKQREKASAGEDRSVLSGVPKALPALLRGYRVGEKAAKIGFDWPDRTGPRSKLDEELGELDEAMQVGDEAAIADELGDVLFSVCNLAPAPRCEPRGRAGEHDRQVPAAVPAHRAGVRLRPHGQAARRTGSGLGSRQAGRAVNG